MNKTEALQKIEELKAFIQECDKSKKTLEQIVKELGNVIYSENIIVEGYYIKIPLPRANRNWTFKVWEWVKTFCEKYPTCYPIHKSIDSNYQYINCENLK